MSVVKLVVHARQLKTRAVEAVGEEGGIVPMSHGCPLRDEALPWEGAAIEDNFGPVAMLKDVVEHVTEIDGDVSPLIVKPTSEKETRDVTENVWRCGGRRPRSVEMLQTVVALATCAT